MPKLVPPIYRGPMNYVGIWSKRWSLGILGRAYRHLMFPSRSRLPAQEAQFVKIELIQGDPNFWWSIHQIDILPYVQIGASASHNNVLFGPDNLNYAVDGLSDTYWSTVLPLS